MNNKVVWLTIGISGCGKSTWANELIKDNISPEGEVTTFVKVERDDLRKTILAQERKQPYEKDLNWSQWNWDWEYKVNLLQEQMFRTLLNNDAIYGIIISDTNISQGGRNKLVKKLVDMGVDRTNVAYKVFNVDVEVAIQRDIQRKYPVGEKVIRDQYEKLMLQMKDLSPEALYA